MATRRPDQPADGRRLRGGEAFRLHLTLAVGLAVCLAAFVFEMGRALGGNTLSWAYVFEWPIFAVFAVYMWWHLLHGNDGSRRNPRPTAAAGGPDVSGSPGPDTLGAGAASGATSGTATTAADDDADLQAWQAYLRTLEADDARQAEADGPA